MTSSQDAASSTSPLLNPASNSAAPIHASINRVPMATYRLQLRSDFGLDSVRELLPYLKQLGITDVYLSPLFRAREESAHGYDVVDHGAVEPTFGGLSAFQRLADAVREAGMGLLLDVVPNHMGINDPGNAWWSDVLENGEASPYAEFFDIDWQPAGTNVQHQVLLPFLGAPFGKVLESGELKVEFSGPRFEIAYWNRRFPLSLPSVTHVLDLVSEQLAKRSALESTAERIELDEIITHLRHLSPSSPTNLKAHEERRHEQHAALERFGALVDRCETVARALEQALALLNGEPGNSRSFDQLEQLLDQQWYRLAYWRVAMDEINYRRFFDINDLAAIRVEDPRVFEAVHRLVAQCLENHWVTGLRIDHPDGLLDPQTYFDDLQKLYRTLNDHDQQASDQKIYVLAEKILAADEKLRSEWDVSGTTGYDFMNLLSCVLVDANGLQQITDAYGALTHVEESPADVQYESKRTILTHSMASELHMLSAQLYRIAQQHRSSRDFTRPMLQRALRDVIASLTIYRTYVRSAGWEVSDIDYRRVTSAVRHAKRRNRTIDYSAFDFIAGVLLLENPPSLTSEQAAARRNFALKFQQVSGPVAAKGVEDTAFYRYYPLAAMNEVGGELAPEPLSIEEFHRRMRQRAIEWPHSMSATATHDTKRGEDFRARLLVLSEIPPQWQAACERWQKMNRALRHEVDGDLAPNPNEEYLLYQTLVGTWPLGTIGDSKWSEYAKRIEHYMQKALREAKQNSSWLNPSEEYEEAVFKFVRSLFAAETAMFRDEVTKFVEQIASAGFVNSLSQVVLKMTLPGVPDFYQGTELWDFNLVDPDNRRPVDFQERRKLLGELLGIADNNLAEFSQRLRGAWPDPRIKLWAVNRCLRLRQRWPDVFESGEYIPLVAVGESAEHVIAFARRIADKCTITAVPRHIHQEIVNAKMSGPKPELGCDWKDTTLILPMEITWPQSWCNELTGRTLTTKNDGEKLMLDITDLFRDWPVAVVSSAAHMR